MLVFYNIGIRLYQLAVFVASFFNPKAKLWLNGREGLLESIEQQVGNFSGETVWVHCSSLGEFEMARPIIDGLKESDSKLRIVLTFFSPSGYEIRKNYSLADHVFYLPLDTKSNALRFIEAIKPSKTIFVKYDLWFHYLNEAKNAGSKLMLISAQFRDNQSYFKAYGGVGRQALGLFDQIFLVDADSEKLLQQVGIVNTTVCGDTRYDRVMEIARLAESTPSIEAFKGTGNLLVCGSTWPEDEKLLTQCISQFPDTKWVIAPHEVGEQNMARLEKLFSNSVRFSTLENSDAKVVIVDSIGLLSKLYKHATLAYVGGAFRTGLHNILEATAYGVPTVFGPNHSRFPDAGEMVSNGTAFSIKNQTELEDRLEKLMNADQKELRNSILEFMQARTGATKAILQYTKEC